MLSFFPCVRCSVLEPALGRSPSLDPDDMQPAPPERLTGDSKQEAVAGGPTAAIATSHAANDTAIRKGRTAAGAAVGAGAAATLRESTIDSHDALDTLMNSGASMTAEPTVSSRRAAAVESLDDCTAAAGRQSSDGEGGGMDTPYLKDNAGIGFAPPFVCHLDSTGTLWQCYLVL